LIYGVIFDGLTFGYGLGDVFYIGFFGLLTVIITMTSVLLRKKIKSKYVSLTWVIFLTIFILVLTVLRGPAYSWNGQIFIDN
jgi:ABC-type iron transport system FetAB permease component